MDELDGVKVDPLKFDKNNPSQHQTKLLFGCVIMFGFRGSDGHTNLEVRNITRGFFSRNIRVQEWSITGLWV